MSYRPRILVLPFSAVIIVGLVAYKLSQLPPSKDENNPEERRAARPFLALDSQNRLLKFERYLGRQEVLLIFFDGEAGADRDPLLFRARQHFKQLQQRRIVVIAISTALPQHNRQAAARGGAFPFPLLSDPELLIHKDWGRYDEDQQRPLTGVFRIDRAGQVAWSGKSPRPEERLDEILPPLNAAN